MKFFTYRHFIRFQGVNCYCEISVYLPRNNNPFKDYANSLAWSIASNW